jgi:hypothetical protein
LQLGEQVPVRLLSAGTGNIYRISPSMIDKNLFPVLHRIAEAFANFVCNFTKINANYTKAFLLNNNALTTGTRSKIALSANDLQLYPQLHDRLFNLKMNDILNNNVKIHKRNFNATLGLNIDAELWAKLDKIRSAAMLRYGTGPSESVAKFFAKWKKGSRKIRAKLEAISENLSLTIL